MAVVGRRILLLSDLILSFMWVCSGALIKLFVYRYAGLGSDSRGAEFIKAALSIINMFFFAFLAKISNGGSYNPLTALSPAISGDFSCFLFTVAARIPAQVIGSIMGVRLMMGSFPEIGHGPQLSIEIHHGALTEGLLTFAIILISLGLAKNNPGSFYMKTWISSVSKLSLQILGSDLTGGCMNPASAMGWAYARGDHFTKEHVVVYWLAPVEATLLAVWMFKLLVKEENTERKAKSD